MNKQSARIDITIFNYNQSENKFIRELNIEFKFKANIKGISKDLLKLISEDESALFIHLLKNDNSGTFTNENKECLFQKYVDSLKIYKEKWNNKINSKFIIFCFLIYKKRVYIYKKFVQDDLTKIDEFFCNEIKKRKLDTLINYGWKFIYL